MSHGLFLCNRAFFYFFAANNGKIHSRTKNICFAGCCTISVYSFCFIKREDNKYWAATRIKHFFSFCLWYSFSCSFSSVAHGFAIFILLCVFCVCPRNVPHSHDKQIKKWNWKRQEKKRIGERRRRWWRSGVAMPRVNTWTFCVCVCVDNKRVSCTWGIFNSE